MHHNELFCTRDSHLASDALEIEPGGVAAEPTFPNNSLILLKTLIIYLLFLTKETNIYLHKIEKLIPLNLK